MHWLYSAEIVARDVYGVFVMGRVTGNIRTPSALWRRIAAIGIILGLGLVLSGCDKCGNSIFRMGACKDMQPR